MVAVAELPANTSDSVVERCFANGFSVYAPKFMKRNKLGQRKPVALFGRYFFVKLTECWPAVKSIRGVADILLNSHQRPAQLADVVVDELKQREVHGFVQLERFRRGQKVMITNGVFVNNLATYHGMGRRDREVVFVE